jgi:Tol biopolymer transport system component
LSTVRADSGNIKLISEDPRVGANYSWSPDGTRIAYAIGDPPSDFSIWLIDANGKNARQFETEYLDLETEYNYAVNPIWMPDGDHLVFLKQEDLYYGDIEGESSTRLTFTLDYPELWVDVSPDGTMIAFINHDGTYIFLKVIDLQGNVIAEEKLGDSFEVDFDWSADSQTVVLTSNDQLWLYSIHDQSLLKLLDCPGKCRNPQWQP